MELPVIDGRFETRGYRCGFAVVLDRTRQSIVQGTVGLGWNSLVRVDVQQRVTDRYFVGDNTTCQEPIFVPRSAQAEEDGWLLSVLTCDTGAGVVSELIILYRTIHHDLSLGSTQCGIGRALRVAIQV